MSLKYKESLNYSISMPFDLYLDNKTRSAELCAMNSEKRSPTIFIFDFVPILKIYNFLKYIPKSKES